MKKFILELNSKKRKDGQHHKNITHSRVEPKEVKNINQFLQTPH